MQNHTDMLIFHTAICAGASQIATDGRRELDVLVATPSLRSGIEVSMSIGSILLAIFTGIAMNFARCCKNWATWSRQVLSVIRVARDRWFFWATTLTAGRRFARR